MKRAVWEEELKDLTSVKEQIDTQKFTKVK